MALGSKLIKSTKRPKFARRFGRCWDVAWVILPNGRRIDGVLDYGFGRWVYFEVEGAWYKTSIMNDVSHGVMVTVDTREVMQ